MDVVKEFNRLQIKETIFIQIQWIDQKSKNQQQTIKHKLHYPSLILPKKSKSHLLRPFPCNYFALLIFCLTSFQNNTIFAVKSIIMYQNTAGIDCIQSLSCNSMGPGLPKCQTNQRCGIYLCTSCNQCEKCSERLRNCQRCLRSNRYHVNFLLQFKQANQLMSKGVIKTAQAVKTQIGQNMHKYAFLRRVAVPIFHCFLRLEVQVGQRLKVIYCDTDNQKYDGEEKMKVSFAVNLDYSNTVTSVISIPDIPFNNLYNYLQTNHDYKDFNWVSHNCFDVASQTIIFLNPNCPGSEILKLLRQKTEQLENARRGMGI